MNVEIGAEAALFPEKEYINGIAVAVCGLHIIHNRLNFIHTRINFIHNRINFIHNRIYFIRTRLIYIIRIKHQHLISFQALSSPQLSFFLEDALRPVVTTVSHAVFCAALNIKNYSYLRLD
jgi:hypothetical protein